MNVRKHFLGWMSAAIVAACASSACACPPVAIPLAGVPLESVPLAFHGESLVLATPAILLLSSVETIPLEIVAAPRAFVHAGVIRPLAVRRARGSIRAGRAFRALVRLRGDCR